MAYLCNINLLAFTYIMILRNKLYYTILLLLVVILIMMDVYAYRIHSSYLSLSVIIIQLTLLLSLLLRNVLVKPLLKIWLIFFVALPSLIDIGRGIYASMSGSKSIQVDILWTSIELFIAVLTIACLDAALKVKRPSKILSLAVRKKKVEATSFSVGLNRFSFLSPKNWL